MTLIYMYRRHHSYHSNSDTEFEFGILFIIPFSAILQLNMKFSAVNNLAEDIRVAIKSSFNPLILRAAKRGLTILGIFNLQTHFLENIGRRNVDHKPDRLTLLQIFCEFLLYSKDISKSMRVADYTF